MSLEFEAAFSALRAVLSQFSSGLAVKADSPVEYRLVSKSPSPFPQHKGEPLFFASVRMGKAYVSYHLMPIYMTPELTGNMSPGLKKRMQGKSCFNFKTVPDAGLLDELQTLTSAGLSAWQRRNWL